MEALSSYLNASRQGRFDGLLRTLYGESSVHAQSHRYQNLLLRMEKWTNASQAVIVNAPGRTELGGNHTDHNSGVVLAAAVHFDCIAVACPTATNTIRIRSEGFPGTIEVAIDDLSHCKEEEGTSASLVRGVVHGFKSGGWEIGSFDACISSDVPVGSGLSSSAAFEVCIGQILNHLFNGGKVDPVSLASIGRQAENVYFGKPCGFMDQMTCAAQGVLSIDFLHQASPKVETIDFDFKETGYQLVVIDTGGNHADLTPEYASIPEEMGRVAKMFGQDVVRGLTLRQVLDAASQIRRVAGDRALLRTIHFIEESDRAILQADALRSGDMEGFLKLVNASGDSSWRLLQNCISTTDFLEQGIPVALTLTERFLQGEGAWRVQGGGFAGTIQAYVPHDRVTAYQIFMDGVFGSGATLPLFVRQPGNELFRLLG